MKDDNEYICQVVYILICNIGLHFMYKTSDGLVYIYKYIHEYKYKCKYQSI